MPRSGVPFHRSPWPATYTRSGFGGCTRTAEICFVASRPMRVHVFPASVRLVDAVAVRRRLAAHRVLARAHVDHVRVRLGHRDRADGARCGRTCRRCCATMRRRFRSSTRRRRCSRRSRRTGGSVTPATAFARPPRNGPTRRHCSARKRDGVGHGRRGGGGDGGSRRGFFLREQRLRQEDESGDERAQGHGSSGDWGEIRRVTS